LLQHLANLRMLVEPTFSLHDFAMLKIHPCETIVLNCCGSSENNMGMNNNGHMSLKN
jgi:hypothetical protein